VTLVLVVCLVGRVQEAFLDHVVELVHLDCRGSRVVLVLVDVQGLLGSQEQWVQLARVVRRVSLAVLEA